jgi:hypothetical protein
MLLRLLRMQPRVLTPSILATDASQAAKDAAKSSDDVRDASYEQYVLDYSECLSAYCDDLTAYSHWCEDDAKAAAVLTSNVMP